MQVFSVRNSSVLSIRFIRGGLRPAMATLLGLTLTGIAHADTLNYRMVIAGEDKGGMLVEKDGESISVAWDYKQNGRGPTLEEAIVLDERGFPRSDEISGKTTFGSTVEENFQASDGVVTWRDATGPGYGSFEETFGFYVPQNGTPYSTALLARALLANSGESLPTYPGGEASIRKRETVTVNGDTGPVEVTAYEIYGLSYNPTLVFLDADGEFFGSAAGRYSLLREGFQQADQQMRDFAVDLSTRRFEEIQAEVAHHYEQPVRIRNVRVFEPEELALSEPKDVVVYRGRISSLQPANSVSPGDEVIVDGEGGTLVAGLYEMHGHLSQDNALLNIAAGVTSLRDMGNENAVLEGLIDRIDSGIIAGPRITRSCFIEGESEFASATGETVSTLEEGLAMVRWCASRDFVQVKLYNSMKPEWAETLVAEAHKLGMRVAGHVPAFSSADAMIEAGFDEITHANQLMLQWVLEEGEDTRTLFRFTAMKRFPSVDPDGEAVQYTLSEMAKRGVVHDPTLAIHELGLTAVDGEPAPMAADIIDNLPINEQRQLRQELFGTESDEERAEYIAAYDFIVGILRRLHQQGTLLVPGTDLGGGLAYHRELMLFEGLGLSPAEVLRRGSYDMAVYLDQDEDLGSIEKGKYADFFLVPGDPTDDLGQLRSIRLVMADGVMYFPSEIYPWFGVKPFADAPAVRLP